MAVITAFKARGLKDDVDEIIIAVKQPSFKFNDIGQVDGIIGSSIDQYFGRFFREESDYVFQVFPDNPHGIVPLVTWNIR